MLLQHASSATVDVAAQDPPADRPAKKASVGVFDPFLTSRLHLHKANSNCLPWRCHLSLDLGIGLTVPLPEANGKCVVVR